MRAHLCVWRPLRELRGRLLGPAPTSWLRSLAHSIGSFDHGVPRQIQGSVTTKEARPGPGRARPALPGCPGILRGQLLLQVCFPEDRGDSPYCLGVILPTAPVPRAGVEALHPDLRGDLQQLRPRSIELCQLLRAQLFSRQRLPFYGHVLHRRRRGFDFSRQAAPVQEVP